MNPAGADAGLVQALAARRGRGSRAPAAAALGRQRAVVVRRLHETVMAAVPAFTVSAHPALLPEFDQHLAEHVDELLRLVGGGAVQDLEFVRSYARRRAAQRSAFRSKPRCRPTAACSRCCARGCKARTRRGLRASQRKPAKRRGTW